MNCWGCKHVCTELNNVFEYVSYCKLGHWKNIGHNTINYQPANCPDKDTNKDV